MQSSEKSFITTNFYDIVYASLSIDEKRLLDEVAELYKHIELTIMDGRINSALNNRVLPAEMNFVTEEMVEGLCKVSKSEVGIAVTGFAGSAGNKIDDGVYYFAIKIKDYVYLEKHVVFGPRNECRASQTRYILWRLNTLLKTFK